MVYYGYDIGTILEKGIAKLYFGNEIQTPLANDKEPSGPGGMFHRFGFADDNTTDLLLDLIQEEALPDFRLAYFPENDFRSHEVGPEAAVDKRLQINFVWRISTPPNADDPHLNFCRYRVSCNGTRVYSEACLLFVALIPTTPI